MVLLADLAEARPLRVQSVQERLIKALLVVLTLQTALLIRAVVAVAAQDRLASKRFQAQLVESVAMELQLL
jgi:hypothetical protein